MAKIITGLLFLAVAGCATSGGWRQLQIDGSDPATFGASLTTLNDGLTDTRQQMFALALVDIARTGAQTMSAQFPGGAIEYTDADFRRALDGLTYDDVIALADESGPRIASIYFRTRRGRDNAVADAGFSPPSSPPEFVGINGPVPAPGSANWGPGGINGPGDLYQPAH